jgi:hypothetical protein
VLRSEAGMKRMSGGTKWQGDRALGATMTATAHAVRATTTTAIVAFPKCESAVPATRGRTPPFCAVKRPARSHTRARRGDNIYCGER